MGGSELGRELDSNNRANVVWLCQVDVNAMILHFTYYFQCLKTYFKYVMKTFPFRLFIKAK